MSNSLLISNTFIDSITYMGVLTSVTQKGQITLPQALRQEVGIEKHASVRVEAAGDHLKVYPVVDITDLAGSFIPDSRKSILRARAELEKDYESREEQ